MTCTTITASRANQYPPLMPRKAESETDRVENDVSNDIDCENAGVAITSSTWEIEPADDDGTLTLGVSFFIGQITYQPYSAGTAGKGYRLNNRVQTSSGLDLVFTVQVFIAETVMIAIGI